MIKAVIFDMDGVISKTQTIAATLESEIMSYYGVSITHDEISKEFAGIPDPVMFSILFKRYNIGANANSLIDEKWEKLKIIFRKNPVSIPGAIDLIKGLTLAKIPLGLASSSREDFIDCVLTSLKIKEKFAVITAGDNLKKPKPHPDIFLITAKKLGVKPQDCVVIEDAQAGVTAAKEAGMKCIAITTTNERKNLQHADRIIDSFKKLTIEDIKNL